MIEANDLMRIKPGVDNFDWLKTFAIIMVVVDHTGYFFIDDASWWSVFGRTAAPVFFFLLGYAKSRAIPLHWIWLGVVLTLLDSWNNDWEWVAPNILFSLALIRMSRPSILRLLQSYGWAAFIVLVLVLLAVLPITADLVDYGAEGWLWALFGLCQRMYVESSSPADLDGKSWKPGLTGQEMRRNWRLMRLLACLIIAVVYVWQEQMEFLFSDVQLSVMVFSVGALSLSLSVFAGGPSLVQPPEPIASSLRFLGRHTLELYFIQLAGSELIINLIPGLAA